MTLLKSLAQTVCVCCFMAAFLRAVFPEGSMKPVINTVLAVYILANVLQAGTALDTAQLYRDIVREPDSSRESVDYSSYVLQLYRESATPESGANS